MNGSQRQVLTTTCLSHALIHVYELSVPALLILIQSEFGAGDFRMGQIVTLYGPASADFLVLLSARFDHVS